MRGQVSALEMLRVAVAALEEHGSAEVGFRNVAERRDGGVRAVPMDGVGVADFQAWRCAVDYGAFALVFKDGRLWQGASGVRLSELGDPITPWSPTPLTLVAFAEAAIVATEVGAEPIGGEECVRLHAIADLGRAEVAHRPLPMPPEVLPDPDAAPFDAVINESGALRRLRWQSAYQPLDNFATFQELDFFSLPGRIEVDWTRLPVYLPVDVDDDLSPEQTQVIGRLLEVVERLDPEDESLAHTEELVRLATDMKRLLPPTG
jgi:hypothetical protein